jgi:hypothetical protein
VRTRLGKAIRAVAQDLPTASLMGINPDRIISRTFLIGGALGGVAGVLFGLLYTQVNPFVGFVPGIKAFTAAVLGGIGSIPGAMLGGLVLGVLETRGGTYLLFPDRGAPSGRSTRTSSASWCSCCCCWSDRRDCWAGRKGRRYDAPSPGATRDWRGGPARDWPCSPPCCSARSAGPASRCSPPCSPSSSA